MTVPVCVETNDKIQLKVPIAYLCANVIPRFRSPINGVGEFITKGDLPDLKKVRLNNDYVNNKAYVNNNDCVDYPSKSKSLKGGKQFVDKFTNEKGKLEPIMEDDSKLSIINNLKPTNKELDTKSSKVDRILTATRRAATAVNKRIRSQSFRCQSVLASLNTNTSEFLHKDRYVLQEKHIPLMNILYSRPKPNSHVLICRDFLDYLRIKIRNSISRITRLSLLQSEPGAREKFLYEIFMAAPKEERYAFFDGGENSTALSKKNDIESFLTILVDDDNTRTTQWFENLIMKPEYWSTNSKSLPERGETDEIVLRHIVKATEKTGGIDPIIKAINGHRGGSEVPRLVGNSALKNSIEPVKRHSRNHFVSGHSAKSNELIPLDPQDQMIIGSKLFKEYATKPIKDRLERIGKPESKLKELNGQIESLHDELKSSSYIYYNGNIPVRICSAFQNYILIRVKAILDKVLCNNPQTLSDEESNFLYTIFHFPQTWNENEDYVLGDNDDIVMGDSPELPSRSPSVLAPIVRRTSIALVAAREAATRIAQNKRSNNSFSSSASTVLVNAARAALKSEAVARKGQRKRDIKKFISSSILEFPQERRYLLMSWLEKIMREPKYWRWMSHTHYDGSDSFDRGLMTIEERILKHLRQPTTADNSCVSSLSEDHQSNTIPISDYRESSSPEVVEEEEVPVIKMMEKRLGELDEAIISCPLFWEFVKKQKPHNIHWLVYFSGADRRVKQGITSNDCDND